MQTQSHLASALDLGTDAFLTIREGSRVLGCGCRRFLRVSQISQGCSWSHGAGKKDRCEIKEMLLGLCPKVTGNVPAPKSGCEGLPQPLPHCCPVPLLLSCPTVSLHSLASPWAELVFWMQERHFITLNWFLTDNVPLMCWSGKAVAGLQLVAQTPSKPVTGPPLNTKEF